jgi:hypothetical protein
MHDTDKPNGDGLNPTPTMVMQAMGYQHPPGFEAVAFFIVGMDKTGTCFVNMPIPQPHLCLHLATMGIKFASEHAVKHMQNELMAKSPILQVPGGVVPPWRGPEGRG